jgi:hypothetical protein
MGFGAPRSSYLGQADLKYADGGDGGGGGSMSGPQPHEAAFLEELLFSCSITSSSSSSWLEAVLSIMDQCAGDWSAVLHEAHALHAASVSCAARVQGYMYSYPLYNRIFLHMYIQIHIVGHVGDDSVQHLQRTLPPQALERSGGDGSVAVRPLRQCYPGSGRFSGKSVGLAGVEAPLKMWYEQWEGVGLPYMRPVNREDGLGDCTGCCQ